MQGRARAPGAGTILNALATGVGSAFAIDLHTIAEVSLTDTTGIEATIAGQPDADTTLVETCVRRVLDRFDAEYGASVETSGELPMAAGLKSSSAAANATVLATLDALDATDQMSREGAARIGVAAAREAGVTVTGAFDDASASMLGGVTITDNTRDELLRHVSRQWAVLVWTPSRTAYSADADVDRCQRIAPIADLVADLALDGAFETAMTVNGFAYCAALEFDPEPMLDALPDVAGVSLSGTGPSFVAVGEQSTLESVRSRWRERSGTVTLTTTQLQGASVDG